MTDKSPPDNMLAYILRELVEVKVSLQTQAAQLEAVERLTLATALALPVAQRLDYLQLVTALQINALAEGETAGAKLMTGVLERWKVLCGDDLQAPAAQQLLTLHSESLLLASAPRHLKRAQQEWLSMATPQEIEQELAEKLRPALAAAAAAKPARRGGASRGRKKPKGD